MYLRNIDYHICDKCNLNCKSCNHYSPLVVDPKMVSLEQAERDFAIIKRFETKFEKLTLLGGEPLLNHELPEILLLAFKYFGGKLKLITNGVLSKKLVELKDVLEETKTELVITEYPFVENYRQHYDKLKNVFPNATYYTYRHEHGFISEHLSYSKTNTSENMLLQCEKRDKCCNYIDGKLYMCHYSAFLDNLKRIANLEYDNSDAFVDLRICTFEEFDRFFETHIPDVCRHCLYVKKPYNELEKHQWERTKRQSSEWLR